MSTTNNNITTTESETAAFPRTPEAHQKSKGFDIYQEITNQIIAALEAGNIKGTGPLWNKQGATGMPYNYATKRPYSGVNVLVLWLMAEMRGYTSPAWLTFKQATELGGTVRKGEKSSHIVYYKSLSREETDGDTGEVTTKEIPMLRGYAVFNANQCEGLPAEVVTPSLPFVGIEAADVLLKNSGAIIIEGGSKAYYSPSMDTIRMPERSCFKKAASFYAVATHELTHWTGHSSRLARDFKGRFGDESYAFEELIAELGAAFIGADIGISPETLPDHTSYVASWLKVLKNDKKAIFTAASQASKAHAFIMALATKEEQAAA